MFVIPYFYPAESFGGPVKVAFDVGRELVRRGHEVEVYTSNAKDLKNRLVVKQNEIEGMNVHYFNNLSMLFAKLSNLFITPELPKKMKKELKSFDIIHAHEYTTFQNIMVHRFAKKYGVPYILQAHGSLPMTSRQARKWLFNVFFGHNLLKDASKTIALSLTEAKQYSNKNVPEENIAIVPNGIDLAEYAILPFKGSFKKKFNIQDSKKIILYLGRIHKTKGIDFLIKAYAHLVKNMKFNNTILVIAGPDDGYLAKARSLADSLGISGSLLFTGFIDDKDKLAALVDANVFATPSFYGFPMTFLEACAVGTPIITTTMGETLSWINGKVGYVTKPNYYDFANATRMIISDSELAEKLSRNCRKTVESFFTLEKTVNKLEQVYDEVAKRN